MGVVLLKSQKSSALPVCVNIVGDRYDLVLVVGLFVGTDDPFTEVQLLMRVVTEVEILHESIVNLILLSVLLLEHCEPLSRKPS